MKDIQRLIIQDIRSGKYLLMKRQCFYNFANGNPDFNFQEFRSNFVARWEYKTGSTIYFVWTNNRSRYESNYEPSILKSFKGISKVTAQNAFMIKISYWFSV